MKHQSDILALKYRPTDFKDLIGQEYLVETIQKSIELGVASITPFISEFSEVKIRDENRLENKLRHWKSIALNACQQCGRLSLPDIEKPRTYQDLIMQGTNDTYVLLALNNFNSILHFNTLIIYLNAVIISLLKKKNYIICEYERFTPLEIN